MNSRISLLLCVILFFSGKPVDAQGLEERFSFDQISVENGLPPGHVQSITQDYLGFLWIATTSGLARFDGYTYKIYRHIAEDSLSLHSSTIQVLHETADSSLWIGTQDGLHLYDRPNDQFIRFLHDPEDPNSLSHSSINAILDSPDGALWIGTFGNGLNRLDPVTHQIDRFTPDETNPQTVSHGIVTSLQLGQDGTLWISTAGGGIDILDLDTHTFSHLRHDPNDSNSILSNRLAHILIDSQNTIWISAWGAGVSRYDPSSETFQHFTHDPTDSSSLSNNRADYIFEDSKGLIWIATRLGLHLFHPETNSFTQFVGETQAEHSFYGCCPLDIFEDDSGNLWFGMLGLGINYLVKDRQKFQVFRSSESDMTTINNDVVTSFLEDLSGNLWIGTVQGINRLNKETNTFDRFSPYPDGHPSSGRNQVWDFSQNEPNSFWISTFTGGIGRFDTQSESFTMYTHDPDDSTSLSSNSSWAMHHDHEGKLWVGTSTGLDLYDPETDSFKRFSLDATNNTFQAVQDIFEDDQQRLWVVAFKGLHVFQSESNSFTPFPLPNSGCGTEIFEAYYDPPATIWLGIEPGHLCSFNIETGRYKPHLEENWAAQSTPDNIIGDSKDNLWLGTRRGLLKYHVPSGNSVLYDKGDGLPGLSFLGKSTQANDGTMYLATTDGAVAFHPDLIKDDLTPPHVVITDFKLSQESVHPSPNGPLYSDISLTSHIQLRHNQNNIGFEYAGIHFREPEKNQYTYRLEGHNEDWVEAGIQRFALYNDLSPGSYIFRVKASNSDGAWNEQGASVAITILPPWWQTTWAYLFYAIGFGGLVFGGNRYQRQRLITKERQQAEIREAQLETKAAKALSREATAMNRALQAENDRKQLEIEKGKELEKSYRELQQALAHLRDTQDQLVHTEKLASLGQLTAGIAHEIKNPLNFVNNFSRLSKELMQELEEWIQERNIQPDEDLEDIINTLKMNVAKIHHHGNRADGIVRSMLEHSRTEPGQQRATDVNKLLDEYVNLAFHSWKASHGEADVPAIIRDYDESAGEINLIPQNIGRVLINLLDNALYAVGEKQTRHANGYAHLTESKTRHADGYAHLTDEINQKPETRNPDGSAHLTDSKPINDLWSPEVHVRTKRTSNAIEIQIEDNGIGIPEEIQAKIFEPFFTTKPTGSGTGLGLSLSYDIVVQGHNGQLLVESEEGEGAKFTIRLPI